VSVGDIVHWLRLEKIVAEIYDIVVLPLVIRPIRWSLMIRIIFMPKPITDLALSRASSLVLLVARDTSIGRRAAGQRLLGREYSGWA
jgi:hypothetical protein